jgi:predicted phosphodiesterase
MKFALIGGVYNNYIALEAAAQDAINRGCEKIYCLGDLGAFGPCPDKVFPILEKYNIETVQGNYDNSVGNNLEDCQCGYTDPNDNYYAQISYKYTLENTSEKNKQLLRSLPKEIRLKFSKTRILLCHGSPRRTNEFMWESTSPTHLLEKMCSDYKADIICVTHTGLHWKRKLSKNRWFVNCGVIGRPENRGESHVFYTVIDISNDDPIEFIPLEYDFKRLVSEMQSEKLPSEFIETIKTGYWTTCLEILPAKERLRGIY